MADIEEASAKQRRPRQRRPDASPETPDPIELAMVAVRKGGAAAAPATALIEQQTRLICAQLLAQRLLIALRLVIAAALLALLIGGGVAVYRASKAQTLTVGAFGVPPALAAQGLTGQVMATRLLDQITLMQSRTLSTRPADSFSNNWDDEIEVAIPNTGATLGDVRKLLRSWIGRETRISGEVVRTPEGWMVTARVSGQPAVTATGPELDPLIAQTAEGVFRQTQPYRHIIYLAGQRRTSEALAAARWLSLNGPEEERPWGLVAYANVFGNSGAPPRASLAAYRAAAEALPDQPMPVGNYSSALLTVGHWEAALDWSRRAARVLGGGDRISDQFRNSMLLSLPAYPALLGGDFAAAAPALEASTRVGTPAFAIDQVRAAVEARLSLHEVRGADAMVRRLDEITGFNREAGLPTSSAAAALDSDARVELLWRAGTRLLRAEALRDAAATAAAVARELAMMEAVAEAGNPETSQALAAAVWPRVTGALVRAGRARDAMRLLRPLRSDCYPCQIARGQAAAAALRAPRMADGFFADAVRQGPSLPFAHQAWGEALAARGDLPRAAAQFDAANGRGPRWADPLKSLGDLHVRQGDDRGAAARYAQAAERAPRWGALHIEWGRALWRLGRHDQARAKFEAAAAMDLSASDRDRLARLADFAGRRT